MDTTRLHLVPRSVPQSVPRETDPGESKRPRRQARNPHPGVLLRKPDGWPGPVPDGAKNPRWRARYLDADTRKPRTVTLTDEQARTVDTRKAFAVALSKDVHKRRDEIRGGAARHTAADLTIEAAFARYFDEDLGALDGERTRKAYRKTADLFIAWARTRGLRYTRDLSKSQLADWAASRAKVEKQVARAGGSKGEKRARGRRSNATVNKELRQLSSLLNKMRKHDIVRLTSDDVSDALEQLTHSLEMRPFLRARQLRQLVEACLRHDAAVYTLTRDKRANVERYKPILPVVLFFALTGMRPEEAVPPDLIDSKTGKRPEGVAWSDVDFDEGKIHIRAAVSKTGIPRDILLGHSPLLAALLRAERSGGLIVGEYTPGDIEAARKRLIDTYGAPVFSVRTLRRTCGTFLTCAPGIFGAAAAYMSSRQLGHSITIAEKHYTGVVTISPDAKTTEAAMQLDSLVTVARCPTL